MRGAPGRFARRAGVLLAYRLASVVVLLLAVLVLGLLVVSVLLSVTALGVLLLALTLRLARWVTALDAWLLHVIVGEDWRWPAARGPVQRGWARWWRLVTDLRGWSACGYLLVKIPLGLAATYVPFLTGAAIVIDPERGIWGAGLDPTTGAVLSVLAALVLCLVLTVLDVRLARVLARAATRQVERARTLEHQRANLLVEASTARRRLERDLHDGTQARLTALALTLDLARQAEGLRPGAPAARLVDEAHLAAVAAMAELRTIVHGVSPPALHGGLADALREVVGNSGRQADLDLQEPFVEPDDAIALIAYFCVTELLTNAARHGGSRRVGVLARSGSDRVELVVSDDGPGGADPARGSGLTGLRDRVATVDGTMDLHSPPGRGTRVTVVLPLRI
ncbi:sensor histidine kinase [Kineococcus gynurae]|uniref:histidine kinase n=1 Tax=Kineococcus gynurae TaxID=452979 RepID=A0ABV5LSF3_9ACTN